MSLAPATAPGDIEPRLCWELGQLEEILLEAEARGLERARAHVLARIGVVKALLDAVRSAKTVGT